MTETSQREERVFVTGATGMVGANLVRRLLGEGYSVAVLCSETSNRVRLQGLENSLEFYRADVTDPAAVDAAVREARPHLIYHLAATAYNITNLGELTHLMVNALGTLNVLHSAVSCGVRRFVYTGSAAEYGDGRSLTEASPLHPTTILGASKASASLLVQAYARLHGLSTVTLRLFTPYGPWEHARRLIPHTILSALDGREVSLTTGTQQRDFVYMEDVVDALLLAGRQPIAPGVVFNICSGTGTAVKAVAELTLALMGNPVHLLTGALPTRQDEILESSGDPQAAGAGLGWQPRTKLEDGLRSTIQWFSEHRALARTLC